MWWRDRSSRYPICEAFDPLRKCCWLDKAWDPDRPNIYLRLAFQTPEESTKFRSVILGLSSPLKASRLRSIPNSIRQHRNVSVVSAATTFRTLATVSSSCEEILERRIYVLRGRNAIGSSRGSYHGLFLVKQCRCWEYADLYLSKPHKSLWNTV